MPLPGIGAARFLVDEMQRDLLETGDQDLDGFFDRWTAAGLPEIEEYRGDRIRSRGEMISETTKIGRAIEKRPELLREEDTGESPILTGVKRIALGAERFQGMMANGGAAASFTTRGNIAAFDQFDPGSAEDAASAPNGATAPTLLQATAPGATPDAASPTAPDLSPATAPFADTSNVSSLTELASADKVARSGSSETQESKAQSVSAVLPSGAIAHRPFAPSLPGLPNVAGKLARVLPRVASGVGVGLTTILTPFNDQGDFVHFGESGRNRFFLVPGDLHGVIEERDPSTGEWRPTDSVGAIIRGPDEDEPTIVAGTREQVGTAIQQMSFPNLPSPQEGLDPPPLIPGMTEPESFPADEREPEVEVFPATQQEPDIEIFPVPEMPQVQAEVFLGLSDEVIRELTRPLEAHRGDEFTRRGNDIVVQKTHDVLGRWFPDISVQDRFDHKAGATRNGLGKEELKERFVQDEVTKSYSIPDIIIEDTDTGQRTALNTGKALKDGRTLIASERRQLERLRKNLGQTGAGGGLPKLRAGMDEAAYADQVEELLMQFFSDYFGRPPGG